MRTNSMPRTMRLRAPTRAGRETGSAAIVGVVAIVILGLAGGWLLQTVVVRQASLVNQALGVQAYYTAEAGSEWACKNATPTTSPISFAQGSFRVVANGDAFDAIGSAGSAEHTIRADVSPNPPCTTVGDGGIEYVLRSRVYGVSINSVDFIVMNTSDDPIAFTALRVTWASPTAYFEQATMRVANGTNYNIIWHYNNDSPKYRWASGEKKNLNRYSSVTLPAHYSAELHFLDFKQNRSGAGGRSRYMGDTVVTVEFFNGAEKVGEITVSLAVS